MKVFDKDTKKLKKKLAKVKRGIVVFEGENDVQGWKIDSAEEYIIYSVSQYNKDIFFIKIYDNIDKNKADIISFRIADNSEEEIEKAIYKYLLEITKSL